MIKFFLVALTLSWGSPKSIANDETTLNEQPPLPAQSAQAQEMQTPPLPEEDLPDDVIFD